MREGRGKDAGRTREGRGKDAGRMREGCFQKVLAVPNTHHVAYTLTDDVYLVIELQFVTLQYTKEVFISQ